MLGLRGGLFLSWRRAGWMVWGTRVTPMTTNISPLSALLHRVWGKVASSGLSSLGVGVGLASEIQPNSSHPRPSPPPPRKSLSQEKDNTPVSKSSFHLQLGTNPIAASNLILHCC